ncbi:MAG TPA: PHP-associated domain-containing protein, partial [Mobilitalea sp.]|nr:PHP-associated domain-containing protein [Mobilitalea sp.]
DEFDRQAAAYAKKHKLPMTAGTDAHGIEKLHSGLAFQHKLEDISDFIASIKSGKYELIKPR